MERRGEPAEAPKFKMASQTTSIAVDTAYIQSVDSVFKIGEMVSGCLEEAYSMVYVCMESSYHCIVA